jgi:hypothetical protein
MVIKHDELCDTIIDPETIINNKNFLEQENNKKTTINKDFSQPKITDIFSSNIQEDMDID